MRMWRLALGLLIAVSASLCPAGARAQAEIEDAVSPYRLVAGDRIRVDVGGGAFPPIEVPVPPDGRLALPGAGEIPCLGRTPAEVESTITASLERAGYAGRLEATVTVLEFAPRRVFLLAGVRRPGAYELPLGPPLRLTQVLSLGGGVADEADRTDVRILRPRQDGGLPVLLRFNLAEIVDGGKIENDIRMHPGDTVFLPDRRNPDGWIYVGGAVRSPGRYPILASEGLTAYRAILLAGGFAAGADPSDVRLLRRTGEGSDSRHLDIESAMARDPVEDPPLRSGDLLVVAGRPY